MSPSAVEKHLNDAVDDQLIDSYMTVGFKGQKTGIEQEGFRLRDHDPDYVSNHSSLCPFKRTLRSRFLIMFGDPVICLMALQCCYQ